MTMSGNKSRGRFCVRTSNNAQDQEEDLNMADEESRLQSRKSLPRSRVDLLMSSPTEQHNYHLRVNSQDLLVETFCPNLVRF